MRAGWGRSCSSRGRPCHPGVLSRPGLRGSGRTEVGAPHPRGRRPPGGSFGRSAEPLWSGPRVPDSAPLPGGTAVAARCARLPERGCGWAGVHRLVPSAPPASVHLAPAAWVLGRTEVAGAPVCPLSGTSAPPERGPWWHSGISLAQGGRPRELPGGPPGTGGGSGSRDTSERRALRLAGRVYLKLGSRRPASRLFM